MWNYHHVEQWLAKCHLQGPPLDNKNAQVCSKHFLSEDFIGGVLEGFGPLKKIMKPDAVPSVFCYAPPPKWRKTSEARIALATHQDMWLMNCWVLIRVIFKINRQNELESEPATKDVGIHVVIIHCLCTSSGKFVRVVCTTELPKFLKRTNSLCWCLPRVGITAWCEHSGWYVPGILFPKRALYTSFRR